MQWEGERGKVQSTLGPDPHLGALDRVSGPRGKNKETAKRVPPGSLRQFFRTLSRITHYLKPPFSGHFVFQDVKKLREL